MAYALDASGTEVNEDGIRVRVVDTIGSGDSFTAAFVQYYLEGKSLQECCRFGNEIGAKVAGTKGGMSALR